MAHTQIRQQSCRNILLLSAEPIGVTTWIDSGTLLDAVDKADVANYAHLVKHVDPIILDTANGEAVADKAEGGRLAAAAKAAEGGD